MKKTINESIEFDCKVYLFITFFIPANYSKSCERCTVTMRPKFICVKRQIEKQP